MCAHSVGVHTRVWLRAPCWCLRADDRGVRPFNFVEINMKMSNVALVMTIVVSLLLGCESERHRQERLRQVALADSIEKAQADSFRKAKLTDIQARLDTLTKKFDEWEDEFEPGWWYQPQKIRADKPEMLSDEYDNTYWKQMYLTVFVYPGGTLQLKTFYEDNKSIYHEKVSVKIHGRILTSDIVPLSDKHNKQTRQDWQYKEEILFGPGQDNGIIEEIAHASDSAWISMRLEGIKEDRIFELTRKDIQTFKDAYELARLLREKNTYHLK